MRRPRSVGLGGLHVAAIDGILEKPFRGERLELEDIVRLLESDEVEKIGRAAHRMMLRLHPEFPLTTFVVGRNINYANVCDTHCLFCAFARPKGHPEAYVLTREEILEKVRELVDVGGTEVLMQGGTHPDLGLAFYEDLLRTIKRHYPNVHLHSLSVAEVRRMAELDGLSVREVLRRLKAAGLDSLPGAGAEILDDRTRLFVSRKKGSWRLWVETMEAAHEVGLHTTATMVIGLGESLEERALHLLRLRASQDRARARGFTGYLAFILWTFQPEHTRLALLGYGSRVPPEEYLKHVAVARLALDNIPNFQASWVTMGPEVGVLSLEYGINDMGSTMMEENVVSAAGTVHAVTTNYLIDLIRSAGRLPAQRNTFYEILRVFSPGEYAERDFVYQSRKP